MSILNTLNKIDKNVNDFLEESLNYNLKKIKEFRESKEAYNTFFLNLKYLSDFGLKISKYTIENDISIFKGYKILIGIETPIYYLVDKTGLCYGILYGPVEAVQASEYPFGFPYSSLLFGIGYSNEISYNEILNNYECLNFNNFEYSTNTNAEISLKELRLNYLPLPGIYSTPSEKYFKTSNKTNFNRIIYKHETKAFYLPFKELIEENVNECIDDLSINLLKNAINFNLTTIIFRRKYKDYKYYTGKITYNTFVISEINLIGEKSEYT